MFEEVAVSKLSQRIIETWQRDFHKKGTSDHVYNGCIKLMKASFNFAIKRKRISVNPFAELEAKKIPRKLRKRFSIAQLGFIIKKCQHEIPEYYCLFVLATLTGARAGEYSALRLGDIDFTNKKIYIYKQYTRHKLINKTKVVESTRIVDISDKLVDILSWHIEVFNIKNDEYMFKSEKGKMIYAKWLQRKFQKLLTLCGYPENYCRVHDLRGQYVDIMHFCGVPIEYISKQVGHSNSVITSKVYTEILHELPLEANRLLDKKVFG